MPLPQHVQSPAPKQTWRPQPVGETRTTIDEIEREFARKKKKELEQARAAGTNGHGPTQVEQRRTGEKVGRNDPCPCGSGLKFKKCHGKDFAGSEGD